LDHVIILDEEGLRRVLASYIRYYHRSRLHLSLDKDSPVPRPVQAVGKIVAIPEVGGLHHRYERRAA
jgi:putative transposase